MDPSQKAVALFDGHNFEASVRTAYRHKMLTNLPRLAAMVARQIGFQLGLTKLYLGIPPENQPGAHFFEKAYIEAVKKNGVSVFEKYVHVNKFCNVEKGIDIRIALDALKFARSGQFGAIILFSQDQDFEELAIEIKTQSRELNNWVQLFSAYPEEAKYKRGVNHTRWAPFNQKQFLECFDD